MALRAPHARLLHGDPRTQLTVTTAPDDYGAGLDADLRDSGYPLVGLREAIAHPWDLALFGTHGSDVFFGHTATRVHVPHGIGAGKRVGGEEFTYGPRWSLWRGRPKYDVMLEASHAVRDRAVAACPQRAHEDWVPYLVAADVAVIDHGSLGVYWTLLARPTLAVSAPDELCAPGSPSATLHNHLPTLTDPADLGEAVDKALATFEPSDLPDQRAATVSYDKTGAVTPGAWPVHPVGSGSGLPPRRA